ncbi:hypothetical protein TrCOL_g3802 [Triparma columacea]|uniref:Rho-GAP domain-containing protein n=1 Tax=Triparma columacea TaxID=722753 RepID=A0A9W7FWT8_9STRA|nr:hypothetical protein TrCOL_g3802 [Triparma columacea]
MFSRRGSEIAVHQVSCIVHRTVVGPDGVQVWEALDSGEWAVLRLFVEKVEDGESIVRLMSHVDGSTEVGLDELLRLEGQWWVKDDDWVEFYKYSSMFAGGEGDTIYGLAFANKEQCSATTGKILSCVAGTAAGSRDSSRPVSSRPISINPAMARPESSRKINQAPLDEGASNRSLQSQKSISRMPSYKTRPPPPPDSTPPRHKCDSVSLVPPVPPATPPAPVPTAHTPQPSQGLVRRGGDGEGVGGKVRVSSFRRPSGTIESSVSRTLTDSDGGSSSHSLVSGKLSRKLSLASFTSVENMIMAATDVDGGGMEIEDAMEAEMKKIEEGTETEAERISRMSLNTGREGSKGKEGDGGGGGGEGGVGGGDIEEEEGGEEEREVKNEGEPLTGSQQQSENGISLPTNVTKGIHVVYNEERAHYEGLPDGAEWKIMNKQFGIPIGAVPKTTVKGYEERIPAVLEMMKKYLIEHEGIDVVGIFRLAPDKDDCLWAKQQINEGEFNGCSDVNIVANLIKVFFRELPVSLLDMFEDKDICKIADMEPGKVVLDEVEKVCGGGKKGNLALIYWLLDLMSTVVMNEKVNRMSAKNMAIVMSPNLYSISSENPMAALTMSQKVADFTTVVLKSRLGVKWGYGD